MTTKLERKKCAAILGAIGGLATTKAKRESSARNGKLGGRPKTKKRK